MLTVMTVLFPPCFIAIKTYFIKDHKKKTSTTKEPGGSTVKPDSVAVTMDGDQNVPNATESDNLMNESHTTDKEVSNQPKYRSGNLLSVAINKAPDMVLFLTHYKLNELPHTIYGEILISILGMSGYVI